MPFVFSGAIIKTAGKIKGFIMTARNYCTHEDTFGENATTAPSTDKNCSVLKFFTSLKSNIKKRLQQIVHSEQM